MVDIVARRCAGLDVHKDSVVACLLVIEETGEFRKEVRTFETNTRALEALRKWVQSERLTHVAMESTGVYWKPIFNILESHVPNLLVVNAHHIKQVPGRKTDVKDCEWIAELLQHGLLRGSFVPPENVRHWRDITRTRVRLVEERTRCANRLQKILEDANIKLGSIVSDVLGASGREMIRALVAGESDSEALADLAKKRLRQRIPELRSALRGRVNEHHRFMLGFELDRVEQIERDVVKLDERLGSLMVPFEETLRRLQTIPGVGRRTAENRLAEIGPDMSRFPTPGHLASWAGICPGNNLSAGKRRRMKTTKGSPWLRRTLNEAAWGATRSKRTYLRALYHRIKARRGPKRAVMAVAHSMLVAAHRMLSKNVDYAELGDDYFDRMNRVRLVKHHLRRLRDLGVNLDELGGVLVPRDPVEDEPAPTPAPAPRTPRAPTQGTLFRDRPR